MRRLLVCVLIALAGCGTSGPASTNTSSESLPGLADRSAFLERYVTFRRSYRELDFHIYYFNGGRGLVPGPSEWDVRVVATVPHGELELWVPAGEPAAPTADTAWLASVPGAERAGTITEWYVRPGRTVGVDRARAVVAYRVWAW